MLPKHFEHLAETLNTLVLGRPRRLAHPVIAFTEKLARDTVDTYARLLDERTQVPCARVEGEPDDLNALLNDLSAELSLQGRSNGRLRTGFPRLETCQEALDAGRAGRGELLERLYRRFTGRHAFFDALEGVGNRPPSMLRIPVQLVLQRPVLRWMYGEWTRWTRSLRWVSVGTNQDFLTYISDTRRLGGLRERILVEAFLRDLEWQLRPRVFTIGRRRRQWHFVVAFSRVPEDGAAWRFIRDYARVLTRYRERRHRMRRTPLVILAACQDGVPVPDMLCKSVGAGEDALRDAAKALTAEPAAGVPPVLGVPVTVADPAAGDFLDDISFPFRWDRRIDYLNPIGGLLAVAGPIALIVWIVLHPLGGPCGDTWVLPTGERVGITDGSCPLSHDPGLLGVERLVAAQNRAVDNVQHPFRTVVFLSPLTVPPHAPGRPGTGSLDELRGVALAQKKKLEEARDDSNIVPIKVLIANTGDRLVAAPAVANRVVGRAGSDPTLEAVIGISQSRRESHQAVQELSRLKLPIIASNTTSDQILGSSPRYYEIAPRNTREAGMTAQFLARQKITAGPHGEQVLAGKAVVVEDPRDEFSQNLAADFRHSFTALGNQIVTTFDYGPSESGPPVHDPGDIDDTPEPSANQLVQDLCTTIGNTPDFVFYASRSQDLPAALDKISQTPECGGRQLAIVGNDENARFIADGTIHVSNYPTVHFYDAAFSDLNNHPTTVSQEFARAYRQQFHQLVSDSGAGEADDAFTAASKAIDLAYQQDPSIPPAVVASTLHDGKVSFPGVSGFITFKGEHDTTRVPPDKLIFVVEEDPQGPRTLLACGLTADGAELTTWGDHFACPRG